ncbi:MAG: ATP-binding cassette domain-containing protein [Ruminococcaceae bacterium]|nr:ATP-binding cassette domain-containing protein [Oscillospiraceae bacterium]
MINIEHLVKNYGKIEALKDVSFSIQPGEIVGFLGPNGAGKSTAMNILCGYLSSTSGSAKINGIDILENPIEAKKLIGFLPEIPPLYLDMTVIEYLKFVYELKGCTLNREKHLDEVCSVVEINEHRNRLIRNLSKGYRQRVGIAQALVGNPPVIIFDEPTVGLDPKQIVEIRDLIRRLGAHHTVILSTHILGEVQAVCDRIIIINKGKIVADEKTENISTVLSGGRDVTVKICGPEKEVLDTLCGMSGVAFAESLGRQDMDSISYHVKSSPGIDIRKALFNTISHRGWPVIGMESTGANLEDIFISAVSENDESSETSSKSKKTKKERSKK